MDDIINKDDAVCLSTISHIQKVDTSTTPIFQKVITPILFKDKIFPPRAAPRRSRGSAPQIIKK